MRRLLRNILVTGGILLSWHSTASAQATVVLPDTSQTTTVTVIVPEQARVTLPSVVQFNVTNVSAATASTAASVTVDNIIVTSSSKKVRLSLRAAAGSFAPPVSGSTTWNAGDVSWAAGSWTGATGSAGTLNSASYGLLASCNSGSCSTNALVFSLAPKPAVRRSGTHTLVVTWKIESGS